MFSILNKVLNRDRMSDVIGTSSYDTEKKLYHNEGDQTAGFLLEISPISASGQQVVGSLTSFLSTNWPKGSMCQFILYSDPNLNPILDRYTAQRPDAADVAGDTTAEFLSSWSSNYVAYLDSKRFEGIDRQEIPVPFRNFRAFIAVKTPCSVREFETRSQALQSLVENRDSLYGALRTCNIAFRDMQPGEYIRLMHQIWNPDKSYTLPLATGESTRGLPLTNRPRLGWDQTRFINDQFIDPSTYIRRRHDKIRIGKWHAQTLTPSHYAIEPTTADINQLIGDLGRANRRQIVTPFLLTLNIDLDSQEKNIRQKGNLILAQRNALPALRSKIEKKHADFLKAFDLMEKGDKFIQGMFSLTLFGKSAQELQSAVAAADALWTQLGYKLQSEAGLNVPLFLASQPFGVTADIIKKSRRFRPAPASTFAMLAPIQADWIGTERAAMLLLSRRGQLQGMDLRDSDTNYNGAIFAPSGSGKSFLTNNLITNYLSMGGRTFVIDVGRSYEKLCRILDGQYVEFTSESDLSLNMFSLVTHALWNSTDKKDKERVEYLMPMLEQMTAQMANPFNPITDNDTALISQVLRECYTELTPDDPVMDVDKALRKLMQKQDELDKIGRNDTSPGLLAQRLTPYSSNGKYARWFQGEFNIEFNKRMVVLELEELKQFKDLQQVVLMLIIASIDHSLYITPNRSIPTLVVMDEAWESMEGANTAKFMETGFRRARKYGAMFLIISQSIFDLKMKNPALADAVLSNCAWRFFLQPQEEQVNRAIEESLISISEYEAQLLKSTHTSRGQYSEVAVIDPRGVLQVGRLHVDRRTMLMYTTNPIEVDMLEKLRGMGHGTWDAICIGELILDDVHRGVAVEEALARVKFEKTTEMKAA